MSSCTLRPNAHAVRLRPFEQPDIRLMVCLLTRDILVIESVETYSMGLRQKLSFPTKLEDEFFT